MILLQDARVFIQKFLATLLLANRHFVAICHFVANCHFVAICHFVANCHFVAKLHLLAKLHFGSKATDGLTSSHVLIRMTINLSKITFLQQSYCLAYIITCPYTDNNQS